MSIKALFSLNCFLTQYTLAFVSFLLLTYLSCCFGCYVSFIGKLLVLSFLSWHVTKRVRKHLNKEVLTSYKRAVLVTGCDSGFGNALAFKLNEHGYRVYATVLDPESDGAKKLLTGSRFDGKTQVLRMDVTNDDDVTRVYEYVKDDLKKNGEELWAVVNNAGILTIGPLDWGTIDTYKQIFEVNTFGVVRVTRTFLPLIRQSKGRFVNLVSMAGRMTSQNLPVYSMSKHAAISFSDALRRETRKYGIRVSTIEPMAYKTPMASEEMFNGILTKNWEQSSDEVKQLYGQEFLKNLKERKEKATVLLAPGENIYEVVDLMVEAVRSPDPQIRYQAIPGNCLNKLLVEILKVIPTELYDQVVYHLESKGVKPAYLRNEE